MLDNFHHLDFPASVLYQEQISEDSLHEAFWPVPALRLRAQRHPSGVVPGRVQVRASFVPIYQSGAARETRRKESLMMINDHTNGALDCTLFSDDLILLVQALNSYGEDYHPEIKKAGKVDRLEGMRTAFELAAHTCALVNDTSATPAQVRKCNAEVRRAFGFYTVSEKETA
jgi:hypothetical protein